MGITSHNVWLLHSVWCYLNEEKYFCCLVILSASYSGQSAHLVFVIFLLFVILNLLR